MVSDGLVPDARVEEPLFYGCPYPTCDFVSDNFDEVVTHIGDTHADEEEFLPPLEIGVVDEAMDEEGKEVYLNYLKQKGGRLNEGDGEGETIIYKEMVKCEVNHKRLSGGLTKSINRSEKKPKSEELEGGDGGKEKNQDDEELGEPNKRRTDITPLQTKRVTPIPSDGKTSVYTTSVVSYLLNYLSTKYVNRHSKKSGVETEVFKTFTEFENFFTDITHLHNSADTVIRVIKKRDVVKASLFLFLLRHKVVYLSFIKDKLLPHLDLNKNSVRTYLDGLEKMGLLVKIPKEDEKKIPEVEEMKILLRKYTRVGNHIHKIEFYCLSGIGGVLVGDLKKEFESIVPDEVMEQIDDVYKGVVPREKRLEAEKVRQRVAEFKLEKEAEEKRKQEHEERGNKRLLELCSPFKKKLWN